jgi:hypothetical protein
MKGLMAIKGAVDNYNSQSNPTYLKKDQRIVLKDGESKVIRFLLPVEEINSVYEHTLDMGNYFTTFTCRNDEHGTGDCPACSAKLKRIFKSYIPVIDKTDGNKVKILLAGVKMGAQIIGLIEEYGDLTKRDFKIQRIGSKINNTTYQFFAKDPSNLELASFIDEIPQLDTILAIKSSEEISNLLGGAHASEESYVVDYSDTEPTSSNSSPYPF